MRRDEHRGQLVGPAVPDHHQQGAVILQAPVPDHGVDKLLGDAPGSGRRHGVQGRQQLSLPPGNIVLVPLEEPARETDQGVPFPQREPCDGPGPAHPERGTGIELGILGGRPGGSRFGWVTPGLGPGWFGERFRGARRLRRLPASSHGRRKVTGAGKQQVPGRRIEDPEQGGDQQLAAETRPPSAAP